MSEKPFPWKAALFASLAVNLLVIGAIVGGYASGVRFDKPHAERRGAMHERGSFMRALPDAKRDEIRANLRASFAASRDLREAVSDAREGVRTAAAAETYDAAAMRAALARLREADAALQASWHESVTRDLSELSPEERRSGISAFVLDRGPRLRRMHHRGDRERARPDARYEEEAAAPTP